MFSISLSAISNQQSAISEGFFIKPEKRPLVHFARIEAGGPLGGGRGGELWQLLAIDAAICKSSCQASFGQQLPHKIGQAAHTILRVGKPVGAPAGLHQSL